MMTVMTDTTHRSTSAESHQRFLDGLGWLPLVALPAAAIGLASTVEMPTWVFMWSLGLTLFAGFKLQTLWRARHLVPSAGLARSLGYLFAWPGMDARAFLGERVPAVRKSRRVEPGGSSAWNWAAGHTLLGATLLWGVARLLPSEQSNLRGWIGMVGFSLLVHFGVFRILAILWQSAGVNAHPVFRAPLLATSVADFWGHRWNIAFRDWGHAHVFRPLLLRVGAHAATFAVFLASGLIHELVISVPAAAYYGFPTAYFLLQWLGVLAERSTWGRRVGLGRGLPGWLFGVVVIGGPAYWLFHPAFVEGVVLPFLEVIHAF